jgi:hypothetical protein
MKKFMGSLLIVLALGIGILPFFTDCRSQGRSLTTAEGKTIDMKCHWAGIAEIGVAAPLLLVGIMNITAKRKETLRSINIVGPVLGALAILFPTVLIGVCANPMMICNMIMKPALILMGTLVIGASLVMLVKSIRFQEPVA